MSATATMPAAPAVPTLDDLQALRAQAAAMREAAMIREGDAAAFAMMAERGFDAMAWLAAADSQMATRRREALCAYIAEISPSIFRVLEARAQAAARDARLAERGASDQLRCWVNVQEK